MRAELPLHVRVAAGLVGLVLVAAISTVAVDYGLGAYDHGYRLTVTLPHSAQGLDDHSDVKIRGVTVGSVGAIHLRPDGHTDVTLVLQQGTRVPDTTVVSVEPLSVFGPKFIDLRPGAHEVDGPFVAPGAHLTATAEPVDLSAVINRTDALLDAIDPADVATIVSTFGESVGGLGPALRRILDDTTTLTDLAVAHLPDTVQFLNDLSQLSSSLADNATNITTTATNTSDLLSVVVPRADRVTALLDGASQVAGSLSAYIDDHAQSFGTFVDSASVVLRVAYDRVPQFPDVFRMIDQFFGRTGDAIRLPGPGGTLIAALHGGVLESLCSEFMLATPCQVTSP